MKYEAPKLRKVSIRRASNAADAGRVARLLPCHPGDRRHLEVPEGEMSTLRRAFDVRTDTATGSVLLVRGMDAYELDPVGVAVWTLCDGEHTEEQIVEEVAATWGTEQDVVSRDVRSFVGELTAAGLLET